MFRVGFRQARDRAVIVRFTREMLRRGPAGVMRLAKNAVRVATGRGEHPAGIDWSRRELDQAGFSEIVVRALHHDLEGSRPPAGPEFERTLGVRRDLRRRHGRRRDGRPAHLPRRTHRSQRRQPPPQRPRPRPRAGRTLTHQSGRAPAAPRFASPCGPGSAKSRRNLHVVHFSTGAAPRSGWIFNRRKGARISPALTPLTVHLGFAQPQLDVIELQTRTQSGIDCPLSLGDDDVSLTRPPSGACQMPAKTLRAIILIPPRSQPGTAANHPRMADQGRVARPPGHLSSPVDRSHTHDRNPEK